MESTCTGYAIQLPFLDDSFDEMYRSEQRAGSIAIVFAITCHFDCLSGIIWIGNLYGRTTY